MTLLLSLYLVSLDLRLTQLPDHLFLLLLFIFFINNFSVWVSPTPTPRTKISLDVPVDRIPDIKLRLDAEIINCPSWAAQEGLSMSFFMYFMLSRSTSCIVTLISLGSDLIPFNRYISCSYNCFCSSSNSTSGSDRSSIHSSSWSSTISMSCDAGISSRPTNSSAISFRSILSTMKSSP